MVFSLAAGKVLVSPQRENQAQEKRDEQNDRDLQTDIFLSIETPPTRKSFGNPEEQGGHQQSNRAQHHHRDAHRGCRTIELQRSMFEPSGKYARAEHQQNIPEY